MIVVGGASMYKHRYGWQPGRAIATLPALTGQLGMPGGGLGPRHRSFPTGDHFADLSAAERRPAGHGYRATCPPSPASSGTAASTCC